MRLTNDRGEVSFGGLVEMVQNIEDATSMSLFQYTKRSTINSRVFIEQNLAGEEILTPLMLNLMNLYSGLIITATDMNRYVQGTKRVRDLMSVVATEGFQPAKYSADLLDEYFLGSNNLPQVPKPVREMFSRLPDGSSVRNNDPNDENGSHTTSSEGAPGGAKALDLEPRNANLPSGRILEVNFGTKEQQFKIHLLLQMLPSFIPANVAEQFIALNFSPSFKQRWMQASAGEISFIKDLMFGVDVRRKRMKALKDDKSGALKEMIDRQNNNLANSWMKLAFITPEKQNIANSILIFSKPTLDKACSNAGLNIKNFDSRQRFFNKTFTMMLCAVDPMYGKIDMYYHGLKNTSTFTFEQTKRNAKTEATDLLSIMKTYAAGMAPKF